MTTWFTADLHLGHTNIIGYSDRPFDGVDSMTRDLVDRWNENVQDDDEVWVLGDFAMGPISDTLPLAAELNGHKILVAGNHDRCWARHGRRAADWADRYLAAGFEEVIQGSTTLDVEGTTMRVSHFPYWGDSHDHDRYVDERPDDDGTWLLHGHVHERWGQRDRMLNVGVDVTGYRPVSAPEIAAIVADGPGDLAVLC